MLGVIDRMSRALILRRLRGWRYSRINFRLPEGATVSVGDFSSGMVDTVDVQHNQAFRRILLGGSTGVGESYEDGERSTTDLQGLISRMLQADSRGVLDGLASWPRRVLDFEGHTLRRNTPRGSAQHIQAHYDLVNEFFELFLDESLVYSCALWEGADDLGEAQLSKFERVCDELDLHDGDRILGIGCGWGGFALHAARTRKIHVVALTNSPRQFEWATARVAAEGLEDRVEVVLSDYRDIVGQYDKIASLEMFEAVGRGYWDGYFQVCANVLRPGGLMFLQTIAMPDANVGDHLRASGWLSKHIFPGGILPAVTEVRESLRRGGDLLTVNASFEIGLHYVRTLNEWRCRFLMSESKVKALGFDDRSFRRWHFLSCRVFGGV